MRLRIDTSENKFRVAALAQPRARSRTDQAQKTTPDGRPVWAVKLTATDTGSNSVEIDSNQNSIAVKSAMKLTIESQVIEIKAGATMKLEAGATMTIKGAVVMIN